MGGVFYSTETRLQGQEEAGAILSLMNESNKHHPARLLLFFFVLWFGFRLPRVIGASVVESHRCLDICDSTTIGRRELDFNLTGAR